MNRRDFLELTTGAALGWMFTAACEAETGPLGQVPDEGDGGLVEDAGEPEEFVIREPFAVILNDPSCSGHVHGISVEAATFTEDTPIHYLGDSHELVFYASELMQLERGEKIPFATIGDGPGHGHCGHAWRVEVGPPDMSLIDMCTPRGTAMCIR